MPQHQTFRGTEDVTAMYHYIKKRGKTQISFCHPKNTGFYKKCGMRIIKNSVKRFYYEDKQGKIHKNKWDKDVFYLEGKDNLVKNILAHPKEKIKLPINFY